MSTIERDWSELFMCVVIAGIKRKLSAGEKLSFAQQVIKDAMPDYPWPQKDGKK